MKTIVSFAVVIVIVIAALVVAFNLNGNSMDFSHSDVRIVITDSMDHDSHDGIVKTDIQSIPVDSMIMIHKLDDIGKKDLKIGDVIAFWKGSTLYTHRIIAIDTEKQTITTRGDNTSSEDLPISFSDVYGKVVGVNTPLGRVVDYIRTNPLICVLIVILAFVALWATEYAVKEMRKGKKGET